ncbi:MAG: DMT family transporter [Myxococcaceae bacterium]|nr:DMT family transporter [Myxococcaceae bacterium]
MSAPISKALLADTTPLMLAALLYLGGGIGLAAWRLLSRRDRPAEAPLRREDLPSLMGIVLLGGAIGPVSMLWGLHRLTGLATSLLLNLEGPFTVLIALVLFREHLGRRGLAAAGLIFVGAASLSLKEGSVGGDVAGAVAMAGACLAWGLDNNLTQRLVMKDPLAVVLLKTLGAGGLMLVTALAIGEALPSPRIAGSALLLGAAAYGASLLLDAHALRLLGASREAALFATAPFIGALLAIPLLHERPTAWDGAASVFMATGVVQLLRERHAHRHTHEAMVHEHLHVHDAHHAHAHEGPVHEPHSHRHRHEPITHDHPHVSDLHHRHAHGPDDSEGPDDQ